MRIGILGSGDVGRALGTGFASLGHEVLIGTRHPEQPKIQEWVHATPGNRSVGSFEEAADFGDLIVMATLGVAGAEVVKLAGPERFGQKVVIDTTNPLVFGENAPPSLAIGHTSSAGEELQKLLPHARVVKAFNIVGNAHFFRPVFPGGPPDMYICGNDAAAKQTVTEVLQEFGWPSVIDLGPIECSRELESLCILWVKTALTIGNWNIAFKVLRK
jgi:8-hydroxy-5-deazaflavin:NADPH oxidoreductase